MQQDKQKKPEPLAPTITTIALVISLLFNIFTFLTVFQLRNKLFLSSDIKMIINLDKNTIMLTREEAKLHGIDP